ncbi:MAG TPA: cysteine synthase family protein [Dehalococcoidia bacterium]|nr:cysteine synthase family protein [Dehalococcoidia bacterium]
MRFDNIVEAIGHTPLVQLKGFSDKPGVRIFAKLEGNNPTGSVKDRVGKYLIEKAEREGRLSPGQVVLEPTSGNTGIALAMIGRRKGYHVKVVMPASVSQERRDLLELYGAEVILSDGARGTNGSIELAHKIMDEHPDYFMPYQYGNDANPLAHYETTAPEIIADLPDVDYFVAGLGTGGTLMGVGRRLKEHNQNIKVIAVEPHPGEQLQGLRSLEEGFVPPILNVDELDGKVLMHGRDGFIGTAELLRREGIFAGISAGSVVYCAAKLADRIERGNIVCLLADGGWKYLSTGVWTKTVEQLETDLEGQMLW